MYVVQVNLMQYMKLSTSRDFRINAATLDAALQDQDDSQEVSAILNLAASQMTIIVLHIYSAFFITLVNKAALQYPDCDNC